MGRDTLKILSAEPGRDPYRPGVDILYVDGSRENARVDYNIWIKENRHHLVK